MTPIGSPTKPDLSELLTEVSADAKEFWRAQRDYTLLVASEKAARAGRTMAGGVIMLALISVMVIMFSMGAAYLIADLVGSLAMGFLCVGGGYLVIALLFLFLWKSVLGAKVQLDIINAFHDKD